MNRWLPALYKREGMQRRVSQEIIKNALSYEKRLQKNNLPIILSLGHLSFHTDISHRELRIITERRKYPYRDFRIKKRSGGFRQISVPSSTLCHVQKWINKFILSKAEDNPYSFAFVHGKSVKQCAEVHLGCKWLIKIDLRHFFESISEIKVYKYFKSLGYSNLFSFELARICTKTYKFQSGKYSDKYWRARNKHRYKFYFDDRIGHLPQGAPTSPMLANCITKDLDYAIAEYTTSKDIIYTRYADDLIFSSTSNDFGWKSAKSLVSHVYKLLPTYGFKPNTQKTYILHPGARKIVLGLLVDSNRLRFTKDFRSSLECHLYYVCKNPIDHCSKRGFNSILGLKNYINGLLAFVKYIDHEYYVKLEAKHLIPEWPI